MKRLLLAATALLALTTAGNADIINVGLNPTSATGHFSNDVGGGPFADQIAFQLLGSPQFITFASATNDFVVPADVITNFTGQLFDSGANHLPGGGDDFAVGSLVNAVACPTNPSGCQVLAGSEILGPGFYFLNVAGIGGGTSGYGGNLTTAAVAVPGPVVGAGLPGLLAACGALFALGRRRRKLAA
jgi:hypothetical protein